MTPAACISAGVVERDTRSLLQRALIGRSEQRIKRRFIKNGHVVEITYGELRFGFSLAQSLNESCGEACRMGSVAAGSRIDLQDVHDSFHRVWWVMDAMYLLPGWPESPQNGYDRSTEATIV